MPSQKTLDRFEEEREAAYKIRAAAEDAALLTHTKPTNPTNPTKPTNPKDAFGIKKASLSCVSAPVLMEVGVGMQEGGAKYGRHNYRVVGVRGSVYYDATMRHMMSWWEGEDIDPNSGLSHITKAICSLVVLRDAMIQNKFNDDRPPRAAEGWLAPLNAKSEALFEKYPSPVQPYTEADNSWIEQPKPTGIVVTSAGDEEPSYDAVLLHNPKR